MHSVQFEAKGEEFGNILDNLGSQSISLLRRSCDRSGLTSNSFSTVAMEIDHATRVTIVANRMTVTIIATRVTIIVTRGIIALMITMITANVVFIHIRSLPVTEAASSGVIP